MVYIALVNLNSSRRIVWPRDCARVIFETEDHEIDHARYSRNDVSADFRTCTRDNGERLSCVTRNNVRRSYEL